MQDGISFGSLDHAGSDRFQRLRAELGVETFGLNLIRLAPRQRGRIHAHERQEEVYLVLEGELTLLVEGDEEVLGPDRLVRVGPAVRRQLVNAGTGRLVLLAMGGAEDHNGRDGIAYDEWDSPEGRSPQEMPMPPDLPV